MGKNKEELEDEYDFPHRRIYIREDDMKIDYKGWITLILAAATSLAVLSSSYGGNSQATAKDIEAINKNIKSLEDSDKKQASQIEMINIVLYEKDGVIMNNAIIIRQLTLIAKKVGAEVIVKESETYKKTGVNP